jgi:hypothetical protein
VVAAVQAALRSPLAAEVWMVLSTPSFIVVVVQVSSGLLIQWVLACSMPHVCTRHPSPVLAPHASCCRIKGHHARQGQAGVVLGRMQFAATLDQEWSTCIAGMQLTLCNARRVSWALCLGLHSRSQRCSCSFKAGATQQHPA